jgi:hypothetical protein
MQLTERHSKTQTLKETLKILADKFQQQKMRHKYSKYLQFFDEHDSL